MSLLPQANGCFGALTDAFGSVTVTASPTYSLVSTSENARTLSETEVSYNGKLDLVSTLYKVILQDVQAGCPPCSYSVSYFFI